jgi:site-specific DNA recombinase
VPDTGPTIRAVALIRMSTARQASSPERQRTVFAEYCARWDLQPAGEYEDLATSATHTTIQQRPGIMAMWADAGRDLFDLVWCEEISRAAREMTDVLLLERYLRGRGIAFVSGDENPRAVVDPSFRKLLLAVEGFRAESETAKLGERVRRAQQVRLSQSQYVGQRLPPGIRWDRDAQAYAVDETDAVLARRAFALFVELRGNMHLTARRLSEEGFRGERGGDIWQNSVNIILRHPMYRGRIENGADVYDVAVPEVVPAHLVARVDDLLDARSHRPQRSTTAHAVFAGLLRCPACGSWLTTNYRNERQRSYRCNRAWNYRDAGCTERRTRAEGVLERALLPRIQEELASMASRMRATTTGKLTTEGQKAVALKKLDQADTRAKRLYVDGVLTREGLDQEIARLKTARNTLISQSRPDPPLVTSTQLRTAARSLSAHWGEWAPESKRELLQSLLEYIVVDFGDPARSEIVWRHVP